MIASQKEESQLLIFFPSIPSSSSSMLAHLTPQLSRKLSPPLHKQHSEGCYYYAWEGWQKVWWILTTQICNKHLNIDLFRYNLSQILFPKFPSSVITPSDVMGHKSGRSRAGRKRKSSMGPHRSCAALRLLLLLLRKCIIKLGILPAIATLLLSDGLEI